MLGQYRLFEIDVIKISSFELRRNTIQHRCVWATEPPS